MTRLAWFLVGCATAFLQPDDRTRYLEQWRADVLGARELGLSPLGVALGALRVARTRPLVTPVAVLAVALRLRESRRLLAVLAVLLLANLTGGMVLLV
ncbi:hypothetical protein [Saccharothrix algeriensis]|uniref:DUF1634 domain-containing protein n=1 Tax=Saccharothrix algeriensis TaxID=173560 RepID=A0A8T8HRV5_9PSEU|nr:hypothetical protein [Saccharothrix algeriensis]MBM7812596.1 hypothetical protein [Saccharothrix algeriensis]QTR01313.1 hypothetical protein J7S33_17800 [Saccharothrix algeriensis]